MTLRKEHSVRRLGLIAGEHRQDAGYRVDRPRGRNDYALIYTKSGRGMVENDRGQVLTEAGDVVLLSPGSRHVYGTYPAARSWHLFWAHFQMPADSAELVRWPNMDQGPGYVQFPVGDRSQMLAAMKILHQSAMRASDLDDHWQIMLAENALQRVLLMCIKASDKDQVLPLDDRVREVKQYVLEHLEADLSVARLGEVVGLSGSRLAHLFRDQVDESIQVYVERIRLRRAKHLLEYTALPIMTIAKEVGFQSAFYFSKRFKKAFSQSPRRYRKDYACMLIAEKPAT
ncbi:helix-turn-helix domain-containing protein [Poriferisphaera sp. WC338]|uniref:helix-turn-helix domain-containing protein n=1 Tax=Poriferisphaera sp. WC338 TaxID=3425129 RepID=UPI003D81573F